MSARHFVLGLAAGVALGGCLGAAVTVALTKGARAFVSSLSQTEGPADVAHPRTLRRAGFELRFPANWRVDVDDDGYDPDRVFSIDSPGSTFVKLRIHDRPIDLRTLVDGQAEVFRARVLSAPSSTAVDAWGSHEGYGVRLSGKFAGIVPQTILCFAFTSGGRTVLVTESGPDEDRPLAGPGLALVAESFALLEANERPPR